MVTYACIMMVVVIFSQTASVLAQVDSSGTTTPFVTCMQQACPAYPNGICQQTDVLNRHNKAKGSKAKRTTTDMVPSAEGSLEARDLPVFTTDPDPKCDPTTLPKNVFVVTDVRAGAQAWCQTMKTDVPAKAAGYISQNLSTAVTKSANELHSNKAVMLSLVLSAYPLALTAFQTPQGADTAVVSAFTAALVALATKGTGCTADLDWYNAGKAHGETSTGAIPGTINIANVGVDWMFLPAQYLKPGADA